MPLPDGVRHGAATVAYVSIVSVAGVGILSLAIWTFNLWGDLVFALGLFATGALGYRMTVGDQWRWAPLVTLPCAWLVFIVSAACSIPVIQVDFFGDNSEIGNSRGFFGTPGTIFDGGFVVLVTMFGSTGIVWSALAPSFWGWRTRVRRGKARRPVGDAGRVAD